MLLAALLAHHLVGAALAGGTDAPQRVAASLREHLAQDPALAPVLLGEGARERLAFLVTVVAAERTCDAMGCWLAPVAEGADPRLLALQDATYRAALELEPVRRTWQGRRVLVPVEGARAALDPLSRTVFDGAVGQAPVGLVVVLYADPLGAVQATFAQAPLRRVADRWETVPGEPAVELGAVMDLGLVLDAVPPRPPPAMEPSVSLRRLDDAGVVVEVRHGPGHVAVFGYDAASRRPVLLHPPPGPNPAPAAHVDVGPIHLGSEAGPLVVLTSPEAIHLGDAMRWVFGRGPPDADWSRHDLPGPAGP